MELLYFDIWSLGELFEGMGKSLMKLYETRCCLHLTLWRRSISFLNCYALTGKSDWQKRKRRVMWTLWSCYHAKS